MSLFLAHNKIEAYEKYINVSSMNSEQRKLCVQSPIEIDARFLRKQAIGCNGT